MFCIWLSAFWFQAQFEAQGGERNDKPNGEADQWEKDGEIHTVSAVMMTSIGAADSAGLATGSGA